MTAAYVHGYDPRENERLADQAGTLVELLHGDTSYPAGSTVLEAGCGVGAQTVTLAERSPGARLTSIDVSSESVAEARRRVDAAGLDVDVRQADIFALPFAPASFDHVFVCFVLEHLPRPVQALAILRGLLRPGGTITVIEGDHGSTFFHPDSAAAHARSAARSSSSGRRGRLLDRPAGLPAHGPGGLRRGPGHAADGLRRRQPPRPRRRLHAQTFAAMIEGVRAPALAAGLAEPDAFDAGIRALHRTTEPDGVFSYTFFKGVGVRPEAGA
jgi:SAM-dependent methyltransferase